MRWVVLGSTGQLGTDLAVVLDPAAAVFHGRRSLDITDPDAVSQLAEADVDVVVNAAAWTAVDEAEAHPVEADAANHLAPGRIAEALARNPRRPVLVHVSTDYVFGAPPEPRRPWRENDQPAPLSVYGQTKWQGERAVRRALPDRSFIVRSAWLYGEHGRNFALTVLDHARKGRPMRVVNDQWGQPTWTAELARQIVALGTRASQGEAPPGIYHGTNQGSTTWCDFARRIYSLAGADPAQVTPMASADLNRPAPRPPWSVLAHDRWASAGLPPWRMWEEALVAAFSSWGP